MTTSRSSTAGVTFARFALGKKCFPVRRRYARRPNDQTSVCGPMATSVVVCSGAIQDGVPRRAPVDSVEPDTALAMPKSSTLTMTVPDAWREGDRNTLAGLRSRWTMERSCAAPRACAICRMTSSASGHANAPRRRISRDRVVPCRSSITM